MALGETKHGQALGTEGAHIQFLEHWMSLNAREKHAHSIGPVVQEGDLHAIHVVCQFIDICLQLSKSWGRKG